MSQNCINNCNHVNTKGKGMDLYRAGPTAVSKLYIQNDIKDPYIPEPFYSHIWERTSEC